MNDLAFETLFLLLFITKTRRYINEGRERNTSKRQEIHEKQIQSYLLLYALHIHCVEIATNKKTKKKKQLLNIDVLILFHKIPHTKSHQKQQNEKKGEYLLESLHHEKAHLASA